MSNLLNDVAIQLFNEITDISFNWIAKIIEFLIDNIGSVGIGIIVFTVILKLVVLPFDIYQRVSMRKQSLKMEAMRPELEKLQKQYANDKNTYSMKMMELYKKNNYSMFSACLPMIATMVILIVAFNSLNTFSQYSNLHAYKDMVTVYNESITQFCASRDICTPETVVIGGETYTKYQGEDDKYIVYYLENESGVRDYYIDVEKTYAYAQSDIDALMSGEEALTKEEAVASYVKEFGREAAAQSFRDNKVSFLWVKNIWYSDTSWTNSLGSYKDFTSKITTKIEIVNENGSVEQVNVKKVISETTYEEITANLTAEKNDSNGYFIFCVLSIGLMFLSQFISMKSSKAQNDLGTVDGQGASSQKMMMFIMPIIFGIFAFTYSTAFSIYMVVSNIFSIFTMLISNVITDKIFHNKEQQALQARYNRTVPSRNGNIKKK